MGRSGFKYILLTAFLSTALCRQVPATTISEAKLLADAAPVTLLSKVVTYGAPGVFYVEEDSRSSGIRVESPSHSLAAGMRADVAGVMGTDADGERYVDASSAVENGSGSVQPLCFTNLALGGGDWPANPVPGTGQKGIAGGAGLNNIGLLVRAEGVVSYRGAAGTFAYIDDSMIDDGNTLGDGGVSVKGVRVILPSGIVAPPVGAYAVVTGVSTVVTVSGLPARAVILRSPEDIQRMDEISGRPGDMIFVPGGAFLMGNSGVGDDAGGYSDELPQHSVRLSGYWIGKYEVTRGEYRQFINVGGYSNPAYWSEAGWNWKTAMNRTEPSYWDAEQDWGTNPGPFTQTENHPVVGVSYYEAEAYCTWAGGHLPTEAQWENAARWDGGPRIYPWGNTWDASACNNWYDALYPGKQTSVVGSYPDGDSPYGCCDMGGDVWEWCSDWYSSSYYDEQPAGGWVDPTGPSTGTARILRGGSWGTDSSSVRCARRFSRSPSDSSGWWSYGFRLVRDEQ